MASSRISPSYSGSICISTSGDARRAGSTLPISPICTPDTRTVWPWPGATRLRVGQLRLQRDRRLPRAAGSAAAGGRGCSAPTRSVRTARAPDHGSRKRAQCLRMARLTAVHRCARHAAARRRGPRSFSWRFDPARPRCLGARVALLRLGRLRQAARHLAARPGPPACAGRAAAGSRTATSARSGGHARGLGRVGAEDRPNRPARTARCRAEIVRSPALVSTCTHWPLASPLRLSPGQARQRLGRLLEHLAGRPGSWGRAPCRWTTGAAPRSRSRPRARTLLVERRRVAGSGAPARGAVGRRSLASPRSSARDTSRASLAQERQAHVDRRARLRHARPQVAPRSGAAGAGCG